MLVLDTTTDNIQVVLAWAITTNQLDCYTSRRDITTTGYTPWRTSAATNSTTDVNIVPAPAASTQRVVDCISIYNKDTVSATVTVKLDANGTEYILAKATVLSGERLEYSDSEWFRVLGTDGSLKTVIFGANTPVSSDLTTVILSADRTNNNAVANTIADVTWLSFSVTSGNTYYYRACIVYTANATSTGSRRCVNHPWGTLYGMSKYSLTTTTETTNHWVTAVDSPAASNATSASTNSNTAILEWVYACTTNGTFIIRFASEVASAAIVAKAGSILQYQQVI